MNYLGHIYLSGENELLMVGNFIGDYVKGKNFNHYPDEIKKGILLHRAIDQFTDQNRNWRKVRDMIKPAYGRYSGVVADLFIDHFLAANWMLYSEIPLFIYTKWVNAHLLKNYRYLPARVQGFLAYLIQHKRLLSYSELKGIDESLYIMSLRTSLPDHRAQVIKLLDKHYPEFKSPSIAFLNEVSEFVKPFIFTPNEESELYVRRLNEAVHND